MCVNSGIFAYFNGHTGELANELLLSKIGGGMVEQMRRQAMNAGWAGRRSVKIAAFPTLAFMP